MAAKKRGKKVRGPRGVIESPLSLPNQESERLFERVAQEVLNEQRTLFDDLNPYERNLVVRWLADAIVDEQGHSAIHDVLWEVDYHTKPVGIEEYIHDSYYMGRIASDLHPRWKEDLYEVFAPGSPIFEWVMCLAGDTVVPLLDGTEATLEELHGRWEDSRDPFWVYSYSRHGWVMPARCTRVTKFAPDQLFRISFSDGTSLRANADHEFVCRDGAKRKVCDLVVGDRLMPFHTRGQKLSPKAIGEYEQVYHPGARRYEFTHKVVGRFVNGGVCPEEVNGQNPTVHHKNVDRRDNRPENVEWMGWDDHAAWHCECGWSDERRAYLSARQHAACTDPDSPIRRGHRAFMRSAKGRELARSNLAKANLTKSELRERAANARRIRWEDPEQRRRASLRCSERNRGNRWGADTSRITRDVSADDVYAAFEAEGTLSGAYRRLGVSRNAVVRILRDEGLTIENVRTGYRNHRITSIEPDGVEPVYCLTVPKYENFAVATGGKRRGIFSGNTGCIGSGKTTLASLGLSYKVYQMSCLRDAPTYYGLLPESLIVFGIYSITKHQVADTGYFMVKGMLDSSPYFRTDFLRNMKIDSVIDFSPTTGKKIKIVPGSQELHALGLDLFSFLMDEVNFMRVKNDKEAGVQTGQAYKIYNATYTRLQSRFIRPGGTLPGMMFLLSSRNAQTSFLEEHMQSVRVSGHSHTTHISDYALWDVKPAHRFTMPRFKVEVGDRTSKSRMLSNCELVEAGVGHRLIVHGEEEPRKGSRVVEVPGEFYQPFTLDLDQALRDIAGVATFNLSPLIHDRESVFDAFHPDMEHPFTKDPIIVSIYDDVRIEDCLELKKVARVQRSRWKPLLNPTHPRFIHVDVGLTGDAYGFAMGHVAGVTKVRELDSESGLESTLEKPVICIDLMFRAVAPPGSEVELLKGVTFIRYLSQIYPIAKVTFDGFESASSIQMLNKGTKPAPSKPGAKPLKNKRGVESGQQSVDRTEEAYLMLRAAHFERRIVMYHYQQYEDEILDLQRDIVKRKVDHPTKASKGGPGSKDVTDAVAGVTWLCMNDPRALSVDSLPLFESVGEGKVPTPAVKTAPVEGRAGSKRKVGANGPLWDELRKNVAR